MKNISSIFLCSYLSLAHATLSLSPAGSITEIVSGGDIYTPIAVSGTESGFLIACIDNSTNLDTRFFDNSTKTWGPLIQSIAGVTGIQFSETLFVSTITSGSMVSWLAPTIGYGENNAYAGFTFDNGANWTPILNLESASNTVPTVSVTGSSDCFMFTWVDQNTNYPYFTTATPTGSDPPWHANTPSQPITSFSSLESGCLVSGTVDTGFMTVWVEADTNIYGAYSTDQGTSWTIQQIPNSINATFSSVGSNAQGFVAVWQDSLNNAYSSFFDLTSQTWQNTPTSIATELQHHADYYFTPYVTGSPNGFIVTWIDQTNSAFASISNDNGNSWSAPTQITTTGGVYNTTGAGAYNYLWFIGASIVGDTVLFTWLDTDKNGQGVFYTIEGLLSPPTTLSGSQKINRFPFQKQFFNHLAWTPSPSDGVLSYNVYRDGTYLSNVLANTPLFYNDVEIVMNSEYSYQVTSVDSNGSESSPITVTVE